MLQKLGNRKEGISCTYDTPSSIISSVLILSRSEKENPCYIQIRQKKHRKSGSYITNGCNAGYSRQEIKNVINYANKNQIEAFN